MTLLQVPASRGITWVRQGFHAFARRPLAFSALLATFLTGVLLSMFLPYVGGVLMLASLPWLTQAFMVATQQTLAGRFPLPTVLIETLRESRSTTVGLLQLGAVYAVGMVLIMLISGWVDGGRFEQLQTLVADENASAAQVNALLNDDRLRMGVFTRFGLLALWSMVFWFAPPLVYWGRYSATQAIFFSTLACWRNKAAFVVYGLSWVACVLIFALGTTLIFSLLGQPQWVMLASLPFTLMLSTVFYASLYFTFVDCFGTVLPRQGTESSSSESQP